MGVVKVLFVILTFFISFGLSSCSSNSNSSTEGTVETSINVQPDKSEKAMVEESDLILKNELANALLNKDFRLYATSGRRVTFPGVLVEDTEFVNRYCGKKFMANTGDVIRSEEQKTLRKQRVKYAKKYNQLMLKYCQKENN
jgi:hypothetical protein